MRSSVIVFLYLIAFFSIQSLKAQNSDFQIFQYTIDDGLPSNECHGTVMDPKGYLWIATDRGLSRYDGYNFKNYGLEEGLTDLSCLQLFCDDKGRIWISTFSRKVFIYLPEEDRIVEYQYNNVLAKANTNNEHVLSIYVDSLSNLYTVLYVSGLFKIDSSGINTNLTKDLKETFFIRSVGEKHFFGSIGSDRETRIDVNGNKQLLSEGSQFFIGHARLLKINETELYLGLYGQSYLIRNDTILKSQLAETTQVLSRLEDNRLITGQLFNRGLKVFEEGKDLFDKDYKTIIPDISVSGILNKNSDLYVTSTDQGLFFLKHKIIKTVIHPELTGKKINAVEVDLQNNLYAIVDKTAIYKYHRTNEKVTGIHVPLKEAHTLYFDHFNEKLLIGANPKIYYFDQESLAEIGSKDVPNPSFYKARAQFIDVVDSTGIISINSIGFREYQGTEDLPKFNSQEYFPNFRCNNVIKTNEKSYLVGGPTGLFHMDTLERVSLDTIHPLLGIRVNDMIKDDSHLYIGTQGNGVLIWDQKDSVRVINTSHGLISNNVEKLHFINSSRLAIGTYSGLSIIDWNDVENLEIENYTVHNGLPANDIYDFDSIGDTLFVGTGKGIAFVNKKAPASLHKAPLIENFSINGELVDIELSPAIFDYDQNDVTIAYKCLDLTMRGDIQYQFSLNDNPWRNTQNTSMNFAALQPGNYHFKVRSANRDGLWGDSASCTFSITKPWWQTNWFYALITFLGLMLLYVGYAIRIKNLEKGSKIKNEMTRLERSALQAQMNPHFIFNCLNSIQSFIMSNEKEKAMEYPAKFARLIRQNLEISTESELNLKEEIDMLKNYIDLERVRFNNAFDYDISVDQSIDPDKVLIPPLLIQPYVENAILHGMKGKEGDGFLKISFERIKDSLKVSIIDNGQGVKRVKKNNHKSMGMSITQKRLNFINSHKKGNYDIEKSSDDSGTKISIDIALS